MRNAFEGSVKNGLKDEKGIYFYFTETKMSAQLHKSRYTCRGYKDELRKAHLIDYDSDDYDPKTGKRLPTKFYMRTIDYSIGDNVNRSNHGKKLAMDENKDESSENSDNSANPKTDKNSQAPQAYGDHHGKKLAMDENDDENARSLDATVPLEENENSQAPQAYGDHHGKKLAMDENDDVDGKTTDKSTISKNENFNKQPSSLRNQPWSIFDHNKDRYIDPLHNKSRQHNNSSYSNSSVVTSNTYTNTFNTFNNFNQRSNTNVKDIKDTKDIDNIPSLILHSCCYNVLREDTLLALSRWLQSYSKVKKYAERISWAVKQEVDKSSKDNQRFYQANRERVLYHVSKVVESRVEDITHPTDKLHIDSPKDYIFTGAKNKVSEILHDHNKLNQFAKSYSNKRVEHGTDWSKKNADTNSGLTTEQLRDLFKDLDNK